MKHTIPVATGIRSGHTPAIYDDSVAQLSISVRFRSRPVTWPISSASCSTPGLPFASSLSHPILNANNRPPPDTRLIAADLNPHWPFGEGDVAVFRAHDALEHLRAPIHTMKEHHRCLASQGWLLSQTPSTVGRGAFPNPTHVSFWSSNSFWYYTRADQKRFIDCPVLFQSNRLKNFFPSEWHREHQNVNVKADLLKVAGRLPGAVGI